MVLAAVGQICSRNNVQWNLRVCKSVVRRAAQAGAKFVCLPEASDFIAKAEDVYGLSETLEASAFLKGIKEEAASSNIWVSVGLHEVPESGGDQEGSKKRCYNSQCLVTPEGELASVYRKLHLFDVDFKGSLSISESGTTLKGDALPEVTETAVGKVGMLTCYDLRFPEVALILRKQGADIITYPSAFAVRTGMAHWDPLLRARAIETQSYVLAAAQVGSHPPTSRASYGKACIIDPWGTIVAQCNDNLTEYENQDNEDSGTFCLAEIDLSYLQRIRKEMPLWDQRRPEVYKQVHQSQANGA
ncbi:putative NIT2-nitrilase [Cystobasidium minutum MCA 4210]|uniref:putative NIT2-nitrilase n=1 Tax=Cystobasidium minutum MCA 4210 TaxID=1397322 RepID=UPI0034CE47B1|eukprot:jgi/Rhomi1/147157/e_gw1.7.29.1